MSKLIALDSGHGIDTAGKRSPQLPNGQKTELNRNYMNEKLFNRAVEKYLEAELVKNGFKVVKVADYEKDTSLGNRVSAANRAKADLYISIHANALAGKWGSHGGIETFVGSSKESKRIGTIIQRHLMKGSKLRDRGVKDGSHLYVLKNTTMPAVLVEAGFMDSTTDIDFLLSDSYRRECAQEIAQAVCEAYGVEYYPMYYVAGNGTGRFPSATPNQSAKPVPVKESKGLVYYRVVVGSFTKRGEATERQLELKRKGFDSTLIAYTTDSTVYLRVVAGSFQDRENAVAMQAKLKEKGFDSFLAFQKL